MIGRERKCQFFSFFVAVTGSDRNPYQATISTFVYALKKSLGEYLVWGGRDGAPRFRSLKKTRHCVELQGFLYIFVRKLDFNIRLG